MTLFIPSSFKRILLSAVLVIFASTFLFSACGSKPVEEVKVSKRMKIEYPRKGPVKKVVKKVVRKKVVKKKKPVSTGKPDVKWVSPRKATIKRKRAEKAKAAPVKVQVAKLAPKPTLTKKKTSASVAYKPSSGLNYVVSLSSYTDRNKALSLARKITADGYNGYVTEVVVKGTRWYRVRCGFFDGYTEATRVKDKLTKRYFAKGAWVDKPSRAEVAKFAK